MPFRRINELTPHRTQWLWPGRLAAGHLALFDGDPGLGKSLITMDLCARITTGRPFADGAPGGDPANVVIANAEDGAADTIYARLQAAGADLNRVIVWERDDGEAWLRLPDHVDKLERILITSRAVYVVLDPIFSFLDTKMHAMSDPSVRQALTPLAALARRRQCAIHLVRHLTKNASGPALYRGLYSIAFIATCRCAWMVGIDARQPNRYLLGQLKNNLDPQQPSLIYTIGTHASGTASVTWHGTSPWRDDDLVTRPTKRIRNKPRVLDFLTGFLANGPRTAREIWEADEPLGMTEKVLRAGRDALNIRTIRIDPFKATQQSWWLLPGQEVPEHLHDKFDVEGDRKIQKWFDSMPRFTPLDDVEPRP